MSWLVFHIVSGDAFFTGAGLLIAASLASLHPRSRIARIVPVALLLGLFAVAASSTAVPYWQYAVCSISTTVWLISHRHSSWRQPTVVAVIVTWCIAIATEFPYHFTSKLCCAANRSLSVIGDSVTAGMGGEDRAETWPRILQRVHNIEVQDLSHVGETAASALKRAAQRPVEFDVVLLEIGGNDVLGSTTSRQFEVDLDALLSHVAAPGRQLVMFELPLPPMHHEFGRIQRQLARKHRVSLVPRRIFLSILAGDASTLDSIHLSSSGHVRMAECVWEIVGPAFGL